MLICLSAELSRTRITHQGVKCTTSIGHHFQQPVRNSTAFMVIMYQLVLPGQLHLRQ